MFASIEQAKAAAVDLKSFMRESIPQAAVEISIVETPDDKPSIEVRPSSTNVTDCIYQMFDITDFCRGRSLTQWIGARISGGYAYPYVRIY